MKKTILIIEGIIAAIAVIAVVVVCLLPDPRRELAPSDSGIPSGTESAADETKTGAPLTDAPLTNASVTEEPKSETPLTDAPVTEAPVTEPPVTEPPATEPPATEPPVTEPPVTEPPFTEPPVTEPPATVPPETPFVPADNLSSVDYSRIVFVGDSRTKTMASGGTYEFRLVPDDSINATWGGTLFDGRALQDAADAIYKRRPIMVFWYGINDVQVHPDRDNVETFIANYDKILSLTPNNPGCKVYVLSILTTTVRERDYYEGQNENIRRYNEALASYCAAHGYVFVDLTPLLTGDECFHPGDNIHFSEAWYRERFLPTVLRRVGLLS